MLMWHIIQRRRGNFMKVNIIKGPQFEKRLEQAYEILYYIIVKKMNESENKAS